MANLYNLKLSKTVKINSIRIVNMNSKNNLNGIYDRPDYEGDLL